MIAYHTIATYLTKWHDTITQYLKEAEGMDDLPHIFERQKLRYWLALLELQRGLLDQ